jgi:hypothetical protein
MLLQISPNKLTAYRLAEPGNPVTEPEHFQDAAASENEARVIADADWLAGEGTVTSA